MFESQFLCDHAVAIFPTRDQAEGAIRFLQNSGHEISHLSMIGKFIKPAEPSKPPLFNPHNHLALAKPVYGGFIFGGWLASQPDSSLTCSEDSPLSRAMSSMGIPVESARKYADAIEAGHFIVFVHATAIELRRVKEALSNTPATSVKSFSTRGESRTFSFPIV